MKMDDLPKVYDLFFPSPPSLKELVSMEIAKNLWRNEVQRHIIEEGTPRESRERISLKCLIADLGIPLTTLPTIERYVTKLKIEIPTWVSHHAGLNIVKFNSLKHFFDFSLDFDGKIHYRRTAERFMTCKGFGDEAKFRMACNYCLKIEIYRIWPKVSSHMIPNEIDFESDCRVYYWVCRLKKQLHEMKAMLTDGFSSNGKFIACHALNDCFEGDWPTVEYFINRRSLNTRRKWMTLIADLVHSDSSTSQYFEMWNIELIFYRHILMKLNEEELWKFLNEKSERFISLPRPSYVLHVWAYIKNKITNDAFCRLVRHIMNKQSNDMSKDDDGFYFYKIWITAPDYLKQAAIRNVLPNVDDFCINRSYSSDQYIVGTRRCVSFLLAMLSDTPIEVRRRFWNAHWNIIFIDIRPDDLYSLMKLCFDYDADQMKLFKEEALSKNHNQIFCQLKKIFKEGLFEELEEFLTFWYSNKETIKEIRLKLLHDDFTISTISCSLIGKASSLNKFIDFAYEDKELATEFKIRLLVMPNLNVITTIRSLTANGCSCRDITEFIDAFAPSDRIASKIKKQYVLPVVNSFTPKCFGVFDEFFTWLFESSDKIAELNSSSDVKIFIRYLMKVKVDVVNRLGIDFDWFSTCFQTRGMPDSFVKKLLKFCFFRSPVGIENYIDDDIFYDQRFYIVLNILLF